MAVVLRCGKQMEKLPHYHFLWIVSFQKQRYHIYARCFLWRQNIPEVNYYPNRLSGGECFQRKCFAVVTKEGVQRAEGTSQLQDWNMELKDLEARRQIGELENGKAEEQVVCFRCQ